MRGSKLMMRNHVTITTTVELLVRICTNWTLLLVTFTCLNLLSVVESESTTTSISTPASETIPPTPLFNSGNNGTDNKSPSSTANKNVSASTKSSSDSFSVPTPTPTTKSNNSKYIIGVAAGFGFVFGLVVAVCIVWRCCCKMMRGEDKKSSNKVAPVFDLPRRPPPGADGSGNTNGSPYAVHREDEEDGESRDPDGDLKPTRLDIE